MSIHSLAPGSHRAHLAVAPLALLLLSVLAALALSSPAFSQEFLRGDVNADGQISISDSIMLRRFLFLGGWSPPCHDAADVDDDGRMNISDQVRVIQYAFLGGPAPVAPYPAMGEDPTEDDLGCDGYTIASPEETDDLVRVGDIVASAGEEIAIPIFVTTSIPYEAFQIVLSYDPEVITVQASTNNNVERSIEGGPYEGRVDTWFFSVRPDPAERIIAVGFIPSFIAEADLAPGDDVQLLRIFATVKSGVPAGTEIEIVPVNDGYGAAAIRNEFTHRDDALFVSWTPRGEAGLLQIVGDQTFFTRGDANDDTLVDLSDAQFTLDHLFAGTRELGCSDAADVNDDSRVDIADPIYLLQFLFLGGSAPPSPFDEPGSDPTADSLGCDVTTAR